MGLKRCVKYKMFDLQPTFVFLLITTKGFLESDPLRGTKRPSQINKTTFTCNFKHLEMRH